MTFNINFMKLLSFSLLVTFLGGCVGKNFITKTKDVFTKPIEGVNRHQASRRKNNKKASIVPAYPERDRIRPEDKRQMGLHYDPAVFEQGAYKPDELKNMLNSKGFDGLVQQTFAEAGGDFDVDVDKLGERMVFASTRYSKNPDICIQSVKGKAVILHTSDAASDMMPKFSPDSKQIAWCSNRYGNWDILVSPSERSARTRPRQLTSSTDDEIHPTWSPDGKLLAFSRYSAMDGLWRIWILDLATRSISSITEGLFPEFKPIADSGENGLGYTLLYQRHRKRDIPWYSIWMIKVELNSSGQLDVANSPVEIIANDKWAAINPTWNPDGKYIAFSSVRKSAASQWQARIYKADDIWVVKADGTDLTQITSHSAPDWSPCWAPDKNNSAGRLFFHSLRSGHENVWSVKPVITSLLAAGKGDLFE